MHRNKDGKKAVQCLFYDAVITTPCGTDSVILSLYVFSSQILPNILRYGRYAVVRARHRLAEPLKYLKSTACWFTKENLPSPQHLPVVHLSTPS